jgi:hypothetical protein
MFDKLRFTVGRDYFAQWGSDDRQAGAWLGRDTLDETTSEVSIGGGIDVGILYVHFAYCSCGEHDAGITVRIPWPRGRVREFWLAEISDDGINHGTRALPGGKGVLTWNPLVAARRS